MSKLVMIVTELGCAYRWSEKWKQLEWAPLYLNDILDEDEFSTVDEDVVGEEEVVLDGKKRTLSSIYREVEFKLGVSNETVAN